VRPGGRIVNDDILIAFDYHKHFYRFDNGKLIRTLLTPEHYYELWNVDEHNASVRRSSVTDLKVSSVFCDFIDIQNLFCFVPVGPHKPYDYQNSVFHQQIQKLKVLNYKEVVGDIANVTIEYPNPYNYEVPLIATFAVNITNGYTVQHIEYNCGYTKDISWKNINKTWVPVAYVFECGSDMNFSVEWKVEWEQVNEKVDTQWFNLEEMVGDREESIPMLSAELGEPPIIIGRIGKGVTSIMDQPKAKYPYMRSILIIAGLIMMFIAFLKMAYDRWNKKD
jgi:hypothetical protein